MLRRLITGSALVMALILVLVACTPGAETTPSPAAPTVGTPTDAPTDAPTDEPTGAPTEAPTEDPGATPGVTPSPSPPPGAEEGTLTIWADEVRAPVLTTLGEAFTAQFNVPVQVYQFGFGDIRDQLILTGPAGEGPDIIIGAHDWLGQLVENGVVAPLDLGDKAASFDEVALQAFSYDGQLYGLPYASEAIALYYNTELVPEPPTTWDELKQIATDLQAAGDVEQGYVLQAGDPYHSYPILSGMGGYIFAVDDQGAYDAQDVGLDSEGGLAYANELDQMVKDGLLRANVDYNTMISLFTEGRSAMFMTGPWELPNIRESGVPYGIAQIPTMEQEAAPFVGVQGMMVNAFAANRLLAEAFLTEYVATDEGMQSLYDADPRSPVWTSLRETIDDPDALAFAESAARGNPMPAIPEMSAVWGAWTDAINLIFTQSEDAESAMTTAAERIRTTIGN